MWKQIARCAVPVVSVVIVVAGCDSGGVETGIPKNASTAAPAMPGEVGNLKDIAKKGNAAPKMP